jgi:hypothetical protein
MTNYGSKYQAYRPLLNSINNKRVLVEQHFTINGRKKNILHNDSGPAVVWSDGSVEYFQHGLIHNENGPALVEHTGNYTRSMWYLNGNLHREDGPAIEHIDNKSNKNYYEYWINGKKHRLGGPAIIHPSNTEIWYCEGVIERTDGPAIINRNGASDVGKQWFIRNRDVTKIYKRWSRRRNIEMDGENFGIFRMEYAIAGGSLK